MPSKPKRRPQPSRPTKTATRIWPSNTLRKPTSGRKAGNTEPACTWRGARWWPVWAVVVRSAALSALERHRSRHRGSPNWPTRCRRPWAAGRPGRWSATLWRTWRRGRLGRLGGARGRSWAPPRIAITGSCTRMNASGRRTTRRSLRSSMQTRRARRSRRSKQKTCCWRTAIDWWTLWPARGRVVTRRPWLSSARTEAVSLRRRPLSTTIRSSMETRMVR